MHLTANGQAKTGSKRFMKRISALILLVVICMALCLKTHQENMNADLVAAIKRNDIHAAASLVDKGADANSVDCPRAPFSVQRYSRSFWLKITHQKEYPDRETGGTPAILMPYSVPFRASLRHPGGSVPPKENAPLTALLLEHNADPNAKDVDGMTLLHIAAYYGYKKTVRLLLAHGANPNIKDHEGHTPLMVANFLDPGRRDCSVLLLQHHADPNAADNSGRTPIMYTSSVQVLELLLKYHANINAQDAAGRTALIQAVTEYDGEDDLIRFFVRNGADPGLQDKSGRSALGYAYRQGNAALVRLLKVSDRLIKH